MDVTFLCFYKDAICLEYRTNDSLDATFPIPFTAVACLAKKWGGHAGRGDHSKALERNASFTRDICTAEPGKPEPWKR